MTVLRLDHGKVHALDSDLVSALRRALAEMAVSGEPLVLAGRGRTFSAGVDLKFILSADEATTRAFLRDMSALFAEVFAYPGPVVAAVNGHALAGGCVLALACDRRVGADGEWRMGVTELRVGVPYPPVVVEILRSALAPPLLEDLVFTGRSVGPAEALRLGLLDEVVAPEQLEARAAAVAAELARIPAPAYVQTKALLRGPALRRAASADAGATEDLWCTEVVRASIRYYVERIGRDRETA